MLTLRLAFSCSRLAFSCSRLALVCSRLAFVCALLGLVACTGEVIPVGPQDFGPRDGGDAMTDANTEDSGFDARTDSGRIDSGAVDSGAGDSGAGDSGSSDVGAGDSGSSDAGSSDAGGACPSVDASVPVEAPSEQTVTLRLSNTATTARFVATDGFFCDAFSVLGVDRSLGFQCGCECAAPSPPGVTRMRRVEPNTSFDLVWDARGLITYSRCVDCGPGHTVDDVRGVLQPVAAGAYMARLIVETSTPADCTSEAPGFISCSPPSGIESPPAVQQLCPDRRSIDASFTLPANGDVTVDIVLD